MAYRLDEKNPLPLYERSCVLLAEGRSKEALVEAQKLAHLAAGEASIFFLIGRVGWRGEGGR